MADGDFGGIEIRVIDVPAVCCRQGDGGQRILAGALVAAERRVGSLLGHTTPFTVEDAGGYLQRLHAAFQTSDFGLQENAVPAVGGDAQRVTCKIDVGVCDDGVHVAVQPGTGVPAAVLWLACVGPHSQHVLLSPFEQFGHICFEA